MNIVIDTPALHQLSLADYLARLRDDLFSAQEKRPPTEEDRLTPHYQNLLPAALLEESRLDHRNQIEEMLCRGLVVELHTIEAHPDLLRKFGHRLRYKGNVVRLDREVGHGR